MNSLSASGFSPKYPATHHTKRRRSCSRPPAVLSTLKTSPPSLNKLSGDDVLRDFLKERELSGDFITKICDELWLKGVITNSNRIENFEEVADDMKFNTSQLLDEEYEGGFLKLKKTSEWLLGEDESAPLNKKMSLKEIRDDSDRRKRLNFLRYEALKRELFLLTVGIGTVCSGYCLVVLSVQAAVSYATGVLFRIGIRSEDLQDAFEKTLRGSGVALSSPRLVIPAAIYALWELSQHFANDIFDFQLVPAMIGLFAYKAAALVQVYRDNEDLQLIFPDNAD